MACEELRKSFGFADNSSSDERDEQRTTMDNAFKTLQDSGYGGNDSFDDYQVGSSFDGDIFI